MILNDSSNYSKGQVTERQVGVCVKPECVQETVTLDLANACTPVVPTLCIPVKQAFGARVCGY